MVRLSLLAALILAAFSLQRAALAAIEIANRSQQF